ncbi:hypothetical protein [Bradyrhizobium sp. OK095]|uniref:hypothetical protein n=1 Tax=Bradyrhizobium sp. OK095 TaxID=1882760 RepID=UPI0008D6BE64|nr:hypothetical protein [Bradyrhizobium sp. OK095]SEN67465.1 hypothetical protein SAMN05443254_11044 [Bradyrhizobium sp. OK095]
MATSPDLPAGLVAARSALKPFNLAKAMRNVAAQFFCFAGGVAVVGSIPLAFFLMLFASFD